MRLARFRASPWLKPALTAAYLAIVGVIAVLALRDRGSEVSATLELLSVIDIGIALSLSIGALILSMLAWRRLLSGFGSPVGVGVASEIFFISQVGKYLPGSVWPAFTQVLLGKGHNIPAKANGWSFVTAMALSLLTGAIIGGVVMTSSAGVPYGIAFVVTAFGVAVAGAKAAPNILSRLPWLRTKLPDHLPPPRVLIDAALLFSGQWVMHGLHLAFLLDQMGVSGAGLVPRSIGAFALAFAAGTLFIIAPAGLGVREGALVALLAPLGVVSAVALAASLTSRFVLTIADLVTALAASAMALRGRQRARSSQS